MKPYDYLMISIVAALAAYSYMSQGTIASIIAICSATIVFSLWIAATMIVDAIDKANKKLIARQDVEARWDQR